jgi:peptidoglycan/LPS O-acetylase OafA/YrhL
VLSYSIYLTHFPLISATMRAVQTTRPLALHGWTTPTVLVMTGAGVVTVALSAVTWRIIERPFLVRKARVDG